MGWFVAVSLVGVTGILVFLVPGVFILLYAMFRDKDKLATIFFHILMISAIVCCLITITLSIFCFIYGLNTHVEMPAWWYR